MIAMLLMLAQAAPPAAAPERFSILLGPCPAPGSEGSDVIVCARSDAATPRLPLPQVRGAPDHPVPSNPDMTGIGALNGSATDYVRECGVYGKECAGASAGSIYPVLVNGAANLAHKVFARKPDKRGRVAIDLDSPPPPIPADALKP